MSNDKILDLILFLKDKEYRIDNDETITVWLNFIDISEFTEIFGYDEFCEGGQEVTLLYDSIAFNLYEFIDGMGEEAEYIVNKLKEYEED